MISKTLRKDRDERYGNAHEMLEALKNLRRKLEFKACPPEVKQEIELEIAHVLLTDIVGYSKLPVDEQRALIERLNEIVRGTDEFKAAEGSGPVDQNTNRRRHRAGLLQPPRSPAGMRRAN
jgi:hypothetical protein